MMLVKVCGVTDEDDALASIEAGATALGLNFWPRSPRYLSLDRARRLVSQLPAGVLKVGVFVDAAADEIAAAVEAAGLHIVQLHGQAGGEVPVLPGVRLWRAQPVKPGFTAGSLNDASAEAYLLDAPAGTLHGGSGQTFDWSLIRGLRHRIVLAGGLDASNVADAIRTVQPWGVDACSRLESAPGKKDHRKVAAFVSAALAASEALKQQ